MKYSKYFKIILNNQILPHLNSQQWARMMMITRWQKVKEMNQNSPEPYKYDLMIRREQEMLSGLTQDLPPNELIREMIDPLYN